MDGQNGHGGPVRWGGRIGELAGRGMEGTEIAIRRISPVPGPWWRTAEDWVRRWPFVAVGIALFVGLVVGLRSER
jgi:hypothetical protein